jgi:hypothetical protein
MTTLLNFGSDIKGYNSFAAPISTDKFSATIAAAGNATLTVPSNYENWIVSFSFQPGSDVWVAYNTTAGAPAGATFASTVSELLPGSRAVLKGTTINCYNNGAGNADIGVIMYAIS